MIVKDILIALLRNAIKGEAIDMSAIEESLSSEKTATLFKVAKNHDVAHLVAYSLDKNGFESDSDIWQAFLKEREQAVLRYEMIKADMAEISRCFDKNAICYIPLKGAVIRAYYPEPWMRTSCDIDILVKEQELDRAVNELVASLGYRVDGEKTYHDISLYSPFGTHLELHHNIKENIGIFDKILTQVWAFSQKAEDISYMYVQENEFLMLHLTAHMAYHFIGGGCGLRSVIDLWLLRGALKLDEEKLRGLLKKAELEAFYDTVLSLGEYWMGENDTPTEITLQTEKYVLLGGVYGTKKQGAVSAKIKKGSKAGYFFSRIFLPYESLAILYPVVKKHRILAPVCQIRRWLGVIFKAKRIRNEIKTVNAITDGETKEVKWLLDGLGL